ncbi:SpoIIE family protein phosphatase [Nocardia goodfellowii]|uniref:Sigma-B regulation protein RsbU (Phosphoserine phosphatase) n=1 Tax=Nocardia goodfellowii TaxID=882446 RepID=A0ABS4QLG3_9NOCA|nr:SpoIIE family protein phosphatase [Nocardia goodfellowii]MBP2192547.1 sigma-B regulation protein RsbU (phosphoserine phosphatase) [Nocardia goodfellowii]
MGCRSNEPEQDAEFAALLEDDVEDLYENAPCGYLSTMLDGRIAKVNSTLLDWLGYQRADLVGRRYFSDLLTVGGRLYHETHFAPLLRMQGQVSGIALELRTVAGDRLPVLVTSRVTTGADGQPLLIRSTVFDARERRAYEIELLRARREAERERERLQRLNATLQRTLLPPALEPVPGMDVAAHYHVASTDEVGGDFYDLFPISPGVWGFFLGDVCGKGVDAAIMTSLVRYTLRAAAVHDPDPAGILAHLNTVMVRAAAPDTTRFCTLLYGQFVLDTGNPGGPRVTVTLAAGGHPPAILMRGDGSADYLPTPGGQLIGVLPDASIVTRTLTMYPGDTLLLYTDGITEARTADGWYGEAALLDFTRVLAPASATGTVAALRDLLDTLAPGVTDDTAVLAVHLAA